MGSIQVDIAPPALWQDFERLTLDICRAIWKDDYAACHGRRGQKQYGVDVFGFNSSMNEETGVQCKKRAGRYAKNSVMPANAVNAGELEAEVAALKGLGRHLDRFILATTGACDADLQDAAKALEAEVKPLKIALWFWEDYVDHLNNDPNLMFRYYENVLKYRQEYFAGEHYFRMLRMAFDRPAIRTPIHMENRMEDLVDAISDVQNAISTGRLFDREARLIDQAPPLKRLPAGLKRANSLLQKAREQATAGLLSNRIVQHSGCVEILDSTLADELNRMRHDAVDELNSILQKMRIEEIGW